MLHRGNAMQCWKMSDSVSSTAARKFQSNIYENIRLKFLGSGAADAGDFLLYLQEIFVMIVKIVPAKIEVYHHYRIVYFSLICL